MNSVIIEYLKEINIFAENASSRDVINVDDVIDLRKFILRMTLEEKVHCIFE